MSSSHKEDGSTPIGYWLIGGGAAILVLTFIMWGLPQYSVYSNALAGKAEFERAVSNRRIRVQEAQAKLDSAKLEALAEIAKAEGAAKANKLLTASLGDTEAYLRWRYIEMLDETARWANNSRQIIYLPTEAGMPILEAGRLRESAPLIPAPVPPQTQKP